MRVLRFALNLAAASVVTASTGAHAQLDAVAQGRTASEQELAAAHGKFLLPNGIEVAMTVQTDTSVDGQLLLRSVFTVDKGPANLAVYSPTNVRTPVATSQTGSPEASANGVSVNIDRDSGITTVRPDYTPRATSVTIGTGVSPQIGESPDGAAPLDLSNKNAAIAAPGGVVSLDRLPAGSKITLTRPDFEVSHIVGQAFGSVLVNTANNRAIDTTTTINLDLTNATPASLGSALPRVDALALEATLQLAH